MFRSALQMAVISSTLPVVRRLIQLRADLNVKDANGNTALYIAAYVHKTDVANLLVFFNELNYVLRTRPQR